MQRLLQWSVTMLALLLGACGGSDSGPFTVESAELKSGTFADAQVFNGGLGCTGGNISPSVTWRNAPGDTKSFALTVFDPDAPTGSGFWHWTIYNIPAATPGSIASGAGNPTAGLAPSGSVQGRIDYGINGYGGPCPPAGHTPHHYIFTLYALNVTDLGVPATAPAAQVSFNAKRAAIASAKFTATYQRPGTPVSFPEPPTLPGFTLTSGQFANGGTLANEQVFTGCAGGNISPSLSWTGVPAGTASLALLMFDPDAPTDSGFWHWLLFNMPPTTTSLPKNAGNVSSGLAPAGSIQGGTDYGLKGYGGPCPPAGDAPHRYVFTLYALPMASLGVDANTPAAIVAFIARNNALAKAELSGRFGR
jgi:Raf kinase inhibitor-like YbhB/YbcL family protein